MAKFGIVSLKFNLSIFTSYLNVCGEAEVLEAYRRCCASLFTERAISYRLDKGFDHFKGELLMTIADLWDA
jgi:phosphoenolpyruvate synthase/pyruvate phosphate dikinase